MSEWNKGDASTAYTILLNITLNKVEIKRVGKI